MKYIVTKSNCIIKIANFVSYSKYTKNISDKEYTSSFNGLVLFVCW